MATNEKPSSIKGALKSPTSATKSPTPATKSPSTTKSPTSATNITDVEKFRECVETGIVAFKMLDYVSAVERFERAYELVVNKTHNHVIDLVRLIVQTYQRIPNYPAAHQHATNAIDSFLQKYGDRSVQVMELREDLAIVLANMGDYRASVGILTRQVIPQSIRHQGLRSEYTIVVKWKLSKIYSYMKNWEKQKELLLELMGYMSVGYSADHYIVALIKSDILDVYINLKDYDAALSVQLECIAHEDRRNKVGLITPYVRIATTYGIKQLWENQMGYLLRGYSIARSTLSWEDPRLLPMVRMLAETCHHLAEMKPLLRNDFLLKEKEYYEECIQIVRHVSNKKLSPDQRACGDVSATSASTSMTSTDEDLSYYMSKLVELTVEPTSLADLITHLGQCPDKIREVQLFAHYRMLNTVKTCCEYLRKTETTRLAELDFIEEIVLF